jgi:hypothetical protein
MILPGGSDSGGSSLFRRSAIQLKVSVTKLNLNSSIGLDQLEAKREHLRT